MNPASGPFGTTGGEWSVFADTYTHDDFGGTEREQIQGYNIESDAGEIIGCEGIIPGGDSIRQCARNRPSPRDVGVDCRSC